MSNLNDLILAKKAELERDYPTVIAMIVAEAERKAYKKGFDDNTRVAFTGASDGIKCLNDNCESIKEAERKARRETAERIMIDGNLCLCFEEVISLCNEIISENQPSEVKE
jgi:hypothetical protein